MDEPKPGTSECSGQKAFVEKLRRAKEVALQARAEKEKLKAQKRKELASKKSKEKKLQSCVKIPTNPIPQEKEQIPEKGGPNKSKHGHNSSAGACNRGHIEKNKIMVSTGQKAHHEVTSEKVRAKKNQAGKSNSKKVEAKRLYEREKKRKQRAKIRSNSELLEKARAKERERNKKRKASGQLKQINELSKRAQRRKRIKWKENSQRYREKLKKSAATQHFLDNNSPPVTPPMPAEGLVQRQTSERAKAGRKKVRRDRSATYIKLKKVEVALRKEHARVERYKKRYQRLMKQKPKKSSPTPRKVVKEILKKGPKEVKKRLLFGEALVAQLKMRSKQCRSQKEKQHFLSCVAGGILKKYRILSQVTFLNRYQQHRIADAFLGRKKKKNAVTQAIVTDVRKFLEGDDNSCMAPGKKDSTTLKKVRKQKRYLLDTMENLHKKYLESGSYKISYTTFCRLKPFWVQKPRVAGRDTCMCFKHANFNFMIEKLHQLQVIKQKRGNDLCTLVCCDSERKECMYGECKRCHQKLNVHLTQEKGEEQIFFYKWFRQTEKRIGRNKRPIEVKLVAKNKVSCTVQELVATVNLELPAFLKHVYIAGHQFRKIKDLKGCMRPNEALVLIDFSENYSCKYNTEIQSVHFGASRQQVTLHTGVIYHTPDVTNREKESTTAESENSEAGKSPENLNAQACRPVEDLECISFCTISESLRHDANAVWAHMQPILDLIRRDLPLVDTLHFQSDSPSTQYRNKTCFHLFTHFANKLQLKEATWNFSEAGHGKGSADGIGGVLKKSADEAVAHGADTSNCALLVEALEKANLKVKLFKVALSDIEEIDSCTSPYHITVPNTMKIHQLTWTRDRPSQLGLRMLSCFSCGTDDCSHFSLNPKTWDFSKTVSVSSNRKIPKLRLPKKQTLLEVTADRASLVALPTFNTDWVAVMYGSKWYAGSADSVDEFGVLTVSFMKRAGNKFSWPKKPDVQKVPKTEILCKMRMPPRPFSDTTLSHFVVDNVAEIDKLADDFMHDL